jgi:hypothetical protein
VVERDKKQVLMYGFLPVLETPWKFLDDLQRERVRVKKKYTENDN